MLRRTELQLGMSGRSEGVGQDHLKLYLRRVLYHSQQNSDHKGSESV